MLRMSIAPGDNGGTVDLLVIGGGVNGCGIARDAAGRGFRVVLVEQDDLAAHTSSCSTKLIHGGLRYLEQLHIGLVRKALLEREVLLASAPHIMWPLRFIVPHNAHLRPAWMIRAGLYLYDHLARRRLLAASASIDLTRHVAGAALAAQYRRGFIYSDVWVDDARLVALTALDAAERGARIVTRTRCERIERSGAGWSATLVDRAGARSRIGARAIVNATGPWVSRFLSDSTPLTSRRRVRLVRGSHIVVPQIFQHRFAYLFQGADRRVIFALPYERAFTLIGTTDIEHHDDPRRVAITAEETDYLCAAPNQYFRRAISRADVIWAYSGVRPLLDDESSDPAAVTRDYLLDLESPDAPFLSVFGGKITTFRKLAEDAVDRLSTALGRATRAWTKSAHLPGGDLTAGHFAVFLRVLDRRYPWLPQVLRWRYARAYGTRIERLLDGAMSLAQLGEEVLPGLYEREIEYLRRTEWAVSAEDILWRRTKLGLHLPGDAEARLQAWLERLAVEAAL